MTRFTSLTVAAAVCVSLWSTAHAAPPFGNAVPPSPQGTDGVQWQHDLPTAHKLALTQNKPILVVFGADWCFYCKKLEKETLSKPDVSKYINETFIPVHLDADKEKKVVKTLKIKGLPCSVVLTPDAKMIGKITGYKQESAYRTELADAEKNFKLVQTAGRAPE
ncbi:MAG: thioredoxin family protein [Planctomycetaceae bacterium]|nr:thioredoxin family protein [Planctomycetaceae bacterium]